MTKELRKGNYLQAPLGEIMVVEQIGHKDKPDYIYCSNENGFGINGFEPIPLTEEWLLKFGFETEDAEVDFMEYSIEYEDNSYIYTICNDGGLNNTNEFPFYINLNNSGSKHGWQVDSKIEIKYVHTLQNIHFALTGQELELK